MTTSLHALAFLLLDKNGNLMEPTEPYAEYPATGFITAGLLLIAAAVCYDVATSIARGKKAPRPRSYGYWLALGSGFALLLVPFAAVAVGLTLELFRR